MLGIVVADGDGFRNSPAAQRHLVGPVFLQPPPQQVAQPRHMGEKLAHQLIDQALLRLNLRAAWLVTGAALPAMLVAVVPGMLATGQDVRLGAFTALQRRGIESKLLVFPDENHWVLKPQNSVLWHDTVNAWLKDHTK